MILFSFETMSLSTCTDGPRRYREKNPYSCSFLVDYADMNRVQMLRKIGELEQV